MKRILYAVLLVVVLLLGLVGVSQFFTLQKAHSSFDAYYAFRGCTKLLQKTDTSATCRLTGGKEIKIVKYQGKWYLDGDLPVCYFNFCF